MYIIVESLVESQVGFGMVVGWLVCNFFFKKKKKQNFFYSLFWNIGWMGMETVSLFVIFSLIQVNSNGVGGG